MRDSAAIKSTVERSVKAVSMRASIAQGTARTVATLGDGLSCMITEGEHSFAVGLTEKYGGTGTDVNPGMLGRAALASCLALGIALWAVRMDVVLDALTVEVEADFDVRGELGISERVFPGYAAMRYTVDVTSRAPESEVRAMLDVALRTSSWVDNLARAVPVTGLARVNGR